MVLLTKSAELDSAPKGLIRGSLVPSLFLLCSFLLIVGCSEDEAIHEQIHDTQRITAQAALKDGPTDGGILNGATLSESGWLVFSDHAAFYSTFDAITDLDDTTSIFDDETWEYIDDQLPQGYTSLRQSYVATEVDGDPYELHVPADQYFGIEDGDLLTVLDGEHAAVQVGDSVYFYRGFDGDILEVTADDAEGLDAVMQLPHNQSSSLSFFLENPTVSVLSDTYSTRVETGPGTGPIRPRSIPCRQNFVVTSYDCSAPLGGQLTLTIDLPGTATISSISGTINWGDGSSETYSYTTADLPATINHSYATTGLHRVTVGYGYSCEDENGNVMGNGQTKLSGTTTGVDGCMAHKEKLDGSEPMAGSAWFDYKSEIQYVLWRVDRVVTLKNWLRTGIFNVKTKNEACCSFSGAQEFMNDDCDLRNGIPPLGANDITHKLKERDGFDKAWRWYESDGHNADFQSAGFTASLSHVHCD